MGSELKANLGSYRLLYFQPDPEDGERITVAVLAYRDGQVEVIYDKDFPKLRCVAPAMDPGLVGFYLETLKQRLLDVDSQLESSLLRHAPQIVASDERKIAWPLTEKVRLYLIERFLHHRSVPETHGRTAAVLEEKQDASKRRVAELVEQFKDPSILEVHRDATPQWVLGRKIAQVRPVAIAVRKRNQILLIDGVDLNVLTPRGALVTVNKVVHTFWQYRRFRQQALEGSEIRRIGVVLNGVPKSGPAVADAHDFALDQFSKESELAVDASSWAGKERLRRAISPEQ